MGNAEKISIQCFGECGCSVTLRKSNIRYAQYYLCNSRKHARLCEAKLPPLPPGMVCRIEFNAASYFSGYTYERPDAETQAAVQRAKEILALGVARLAIEKARTGS